MSFVSDILRSGLPKSNQETSRIANHMDPETASDLPYVTQSKAVGGFAGLIVTPGSRTGGQ